MPNVPTVDAPTVEQSGAPLGISAPAEAFSGNVVGEGLKQIGATEQQGSDMLQRHAEQYQAINNKSEADAAYVQHLQGLNQFNADYQANNRGMAAANNLPAAFKTIDQQRTDISNSLSNPMAKAMFDMDSRRATSNITGELSRFAAAQRHESILKTATAVQEALVSDLALHPENVVANGKQMMEQQLVINSELGLSDEAGALEARKSYGQMIATASQVMAGNGKIQQAADFLEAHKAGMDGKVYEQTLMQLKPGLEANDAASMAHAAVQDALHGMGSAVGPTVDYLNSVHGREGEARNPHSSADGIGQFTEGTWLATLKNDPQFKADIVGKSDAQVLQMRHDPGVANRAILSYAQSNASYLGSKGLPVNSATVGLAHGFGPGGAEGILKAIQTNPNEKVDQVVGPHTAQINHVSGQTVSAVFQGFQSRFPGSSVDSTAGGDPTSYGLASRMQSTIALARASSQARYPGNQVIEDQTVSRAITELNQQIGAAKDVESNAYNTLGNFALANQVQDLPTLLNSVPNGLQMYNKLPSSQRTALQADVHRNAVELTPERFQTRTILDGAYSVRATDPQQFLSMDIRNMPLTLQDKLKYGKMQDELRNKPAATADPNEKIVTQLIHSQQYQSLTSPAGLNIKPGSTDEQHLLGTVSGQLDAWRAAHPNQQPGQKDVAAILASAVSQTSYHRYVGGVAIPFTGETTYNFKDISDEDKAGAVAYLNHNRIAVTENSIARTVAEAKARQGVK